MSSTVLLGALKNSLRMSKSSNGLHELTVTCDEERYSNWKICLWVCADSEIKRIKCHFYEAKELGRDISKLGHAKSTKLDCLLCQPDTQSYWHEE